MRIERDFQIQIARRAAADARSTLAAQSQMLALADTFRNIDVELALLHRGLASGIDNRHAQRNGLACAAKCVLEIDRDPRVMVVALRLHAGVPALTACRLTEDRFEKIAEIGRIAEARAATAAGKFETASAGCRWVEILATLVTTADVVIGGPALRIAECLVGLGHLFEAGFGVGLLADIGMIFARQLAVGAFDVVLRRCLVDTEGGVIVLEFHSVCPERLLTFDGTIVPQQCPFSAYPSASPATPAAMQAAPAMRQPRSPSPSNRPPSSAANSIETSRAGATWLSGASVTAYKTNT